MTTAAGAAAGHAARMAALAAELDRLAAWLPAGRPVAYLDYPAYLNVGDLLIHAGAEAWLEARGYRVTARATALDFGRRDRQRITADTTILLQGGGNFGDLYPLHQRFRERVIVSFPDNRIVVLPQSIHFTSDAALAATAAVFNRHSRLAVAVRDRPSLAVLRERFACEAALLPDTAHALWRRLPAPPVRGTGTLRFLRRDRESARGGASSDGLDWPDLLTAFDRRRHAAFVALLKADRRLGHVLPSDRLWRPFRDALIRRAVARFGGAERVVTDRLHGLILACLLGVEARHLDNAHGKLSRYAAAWLDGCAAASADAGDVR